MNRDQSLSDRIRHNIRSRLVSGLLILIPLGITLFFLRFLFRLLSGVLRPLINVLFEPLPEYLVTAVSLAVLFIAVYLTGVVGAYVLGRRALALGESILRRIPLVSSIYQASKQVVDSFTGSSREAFKSVVLVEFPRSGLKSIGFVTGEIADDKGIECFKVFIPTAPNPTSGFLQIVPRGDVVETSLSMEEALKLVMSAGAIAPRKLESRSQKEHH